MPGGRKKIRMPQLYDDVKRHVCTANPAWTDSHCWAVAVRWVAHCATTGDVNLPGKRAGTVAKARCAAAYAQWKARHPKGSGLGPPKRV